MSDLENDVSEDQLASGITTYQILFDLFEGTGY